MNGARMLYKFTFSAGAVVSCFFGRAGLISEDDRCVRCRRDAARDTPARGQGGIAGLWLVNCTQH